MKRFVPVSTAVFMLGLILVATWLWAPLGENQSLQDALADAQKYDAEVIRDSWGVPHIFGARDADVAFGLGYTQSEDDLGTVQTVLAASRGQLARYRGLDAAISDYLVTVLGVWDLIDDKYESDLAEPARLMAEAYAAGVNLYAAEHPEKAFQGLFPMTGKDVIAGFVFKSPFFYGADKVMTSLITGTDDRALAIAPVDAKTAFHLLPLTPIEIGSNAIAIGPSRSTDGVTRLLVNSHQPYIGPVAWYEAHLVSEEGLDVYGGTFPGGPLIFHGFNRNLGWANTVNNPDLIDVYQLTLNPDNDNEYLMDGEYLAFEQHIAAIDVAVWGPFAYPAREIAYRSIHGPVFKTERGTFALRYAGMNEVRQLEQYRRLNKAANFEEWSAAMAMVALPSINYVYADKDGNIAFVYNGQFPVRAQGWDWTIDLPGDRSDLIWDEYHPYSAIPKLINPSSGLVFSANNSPFRATNGSDNLVRENFDPTFGLQDDDTNRSLRLMELTDDMQPISRDRLLQIKFDKTYSTRSTAAEIIREILAKDWSADSTLSAAADVLREWNLATDTGNRQAALGVLTTMGHVTASITGIEAKSPSEAFKDAAYLLMESYGQLDPEWGELNRIVRGDVNLAIGGGPDILRAVYSAGDPVDGKLQAVAGDTLIILAEWPADGSVKASTIHQFGSATLDENSQHYADQVALFVDEKFRPVLLDRADIEADASATYWPGKR
ncbi:MAG: penicillin acylase family protein [Proteobacteria bacterium]|nr:penicillin acylase family protein [Pseudomonadota bacterium]